MQWIRDGSEKVRDGNFTSWRIVFQKLTHIIMLQRIFPRIHQDRLYNHVTIDFFCSVIKPWLN